MQGPGDRRSVPKHHPRTLLSPVEAARLLLAAVRAKIFRTLAHSEAEIHLKPKMNRRQLAQGVSASLAAVAFTPPQLLAAAPRPSPPLSWVDVHPGVWKATLGQPEAHTPISLRSVPPSIEGLGRLPAVAAPPLAVPHGSVTERGSRLSLQLQPDEQIYGFGLQLLSFEQRGKKRIIRVNADPKGDAGDSHAPVPFYVTTRGYGVLVDTLRNAQFYCGDAHPRPTEPINANALLLNTPEEMRSRDDAKPAQVEVEIPRAPGVDIYLFAGPTMIEAVQRYNLFSGGGVLPPEWGLGFWYRAEMHGDHTALIKLAQQFRDRKIPCDVLGLEPGWQTHAYSCTFAWNPERFPDPKAFLDEAAKLGYKVNLWEHAFTHPASPIFPPLVPHSGDFAVWEGLVPDFAGEPARRIFGDYHGKQLIDQGVSGFKLDECDNSDYTGGWSFPDMSRFPSGLDGEQMHATFGLRYQDALWQQFKSRQQPTLNLVRSSGALAAPYPFVLYSDLYDHRQFIRALATSGFSGLLWCPEVRDATSEEDLIRRLQSVVFSPLAMVNAWYINHPPWQQIDRTLNNQDKLAGNWQHLETRCREIIGWRMQLVPYLLSAFERYQRDGTPPFRAVALDYPDEKNLRTIDDAYLVGDRMLVAPLFAGEPGRTVILPPGVWHDLWTGHLVEGSTIEVPASTDKIPVFVKAGSVLPLASVGASHAAPESRELSVHIYGDGHLPWQLGNGLHLSWNPTEKNGRVQLGMPSDRPYSVVQWKQMG